MVVDAHGYHSYTFTLLQACYKMLCERWLTTGIARGLHAKSRMHLSYQFSAALDIFRITQFSRTLARNAAAVSCQFCIQRDARNARYMYMSVLNNIHIHTRIDAVRT